MMKMRRVESIAREHSAGEIDCNREGWLRIRQGRAYSRPFMNHLVCRLAALSLVASALTACGRKKPAVRQTESAAQLIGNPIESASHATAPVAESPAASPSQAAAVVDPVVANVPTDLLAADGAYEAWFKRYNLDLHDPKMLDADLDEDGASNREEFMADTNPRDPNSRPGIHKVMRLKEYSEVKVPMILESVEGHNARIKHVDAKGEPASSTVTIGQTIDGMKVEKIVSRRETDKNGEPVDLSRVDLDDPTTNAKVVLVKDMPARSAASYAVLTSADGTSVKVHPGETFAWPTTNGGTYKVIDLRIDQAVVQDVATRQMWTIPRK
jgi:rhodanese-related sulfurtransferase